ncbi:MAG: glycoside hydrolase family 31 protein [Armatimonadetes bacterium]|nr:glycoside hydrolase family 31 protein [Armatimonadota bacterium]
MFYTKSPHPINFEYITRIDPKTGEGAIGQQPLVVQIEAHADDVYQVSVQAARLWVEDMNLVPLISPTSGDDRSKLVMDSRGHLSLSVDGEVVMKSQPDMGFGICGKSSVFCFVYDGADQYFGLGEKAFPQLEVSRMRTKFFNTDVLGDFPYEQWHSHPVDPYYVSIPYVILRRGDHWIGLLMHNPFAPFIDTGSDATFFGDQDENRRLVLGAEDGMPSLWIVVADSLANLTSKFAKLCGTAPVPPLWSLGYHQCRWGYKGEKDILEIDEKLTQHQIPNDGIWLDIDYMTGYRVFTYDKNEFPLGVAKTLAKVKGRRIIPIIDPGVKLDKGYEVYDSGVQADVFCKTPQGKDYVGFVWPGLTVYPDFSLAKAREWWAGYAEKFMEQGFQGAWLDMNDPSTGAVDPSAMLFKSGQQSHLMFRNQYALGMQMATRAGFEKAQPNLRPFLLSRSGYVGTSRYSAVWTGDNVSTRFYLKAHIPQTLNLGLSGVAFSGNDIGGFADNTTEPLMLDWTRAYFLLPFFRIHSMHANRVQEPWTFSREALGIIRRYIRLRYTLLPYLYQLFIEHAENGHPIWRPTLYHYDAKRPIDDQFMVGPNILQAPFLEEGKSRYVILPGRKPWFDARNGEWMKPGRATVEYNSSESPLYFRDGAIIPALPGKRETSEKDLTKVDMHFFFATGAGETVYTFDDGETLDYQIGKRSQISIRALRRGTRLSITTEVLSEGFGAAEIVGYIYGDIEEVFVNGRRVRLAKTEKTWTGDNLPAKRFSLIG